MKIYRVDDPTALVFRDGGYGLTTIGVNLRDVDPASIQVLSSTRRHDRTSCANSQRLCDDAGLGFETKERAELFDVSDIMHWTSAITFDMELNSKGNEAWFYIDDLQYAGLFAKALRRVVELCGAK